MTLLGHEDDCPRCQEGDHRHCLEDPSVGVVCGCAEGAADGCRRGVDPGRLVWENRSVSRAGPPAGAARLRGRDRGDDMASDISDGRICPRCGRGGVAPRCRYHDDCLSSAAVGGTTSRSAAPEVEQPQRWYDDETGVWRWSWAVWMDTVCGERVYTTLAAGAPHDCGLYFMGPEPDLETPCTYWHLSADQGDTAEQIDWDAIDLDTVLPEPPSTFEAGFPEVYFRPRGHSKDEDGEAVDHTVSVSRQELLERAAEYEPWLPTEVADDAAVQAHRFTDLEMRAAEYLRLLEDAMDLVHGRVAS